MNYKFLPLSIACSLAISLPLVSCSDSEIQSSDIPEMTQSIFVVPENFHGEISSSQYKPSDKFYVKINEKIRICGIYSINGEYIETDEALSYYNSHKWIIDGKESESSALYYSFDKAGIHDVTFETVDHLGDTLRTNAKIYVNTPSSVTLQTPANKYNQVDGDNENGLELSWGISGIDPWETAYCTVYASYAMVTLWESALGNIDCSESVSLVGDLNAETNEIGDIINHTTETSTIYWGVRATIKDEKGKTLAKSKKQTLNVSKGKNVDFQTELTLNNCRLWSVETPYIYNMTTEVFDGAKKVDSYESTFGVRTAEFTSDKGFLLNGKQVKLKGFCMHQDDASLGAALPYRSMQRRLEICKEYGVNAIRCSHNQPAPEFLDLCDEMGFIVIDEAFDKWKSGYYAEYFDEWWKADLSNMIIRDRNHPCVVTWSEGNELQEAWDGTGEGVARAKMLQDFIHELEPTRQVCIACQNRHNEQFSGVTDVVGYNYLEARMLSDHQKFPERKFLVTEELPYFCGAEGNIRAYDTNNPWNIIEENEWIAGGFLWSGMDYIGEASWPSHGWPTGLFDINMIEKPRAAFHRAMWNKDKPLVSIAVKERRIDDGSEHHHQL